MIPYSEDALDGRTRERVGRHLAACERCGADLAAIRSVAGVFANAPGPAVEPAADLWARVSERIAAEAPRPVRRSWLRAPQAISAAAAAVLVVAVGITVMRSGLFTENVTTERSRMDRPPVGRVYDEGDKAGGAPLAKLRQPAEEKTGIAAAKSAAPSIELRRPAGTRSQPVPSPPPSVGDLIARAPAGPAPRLKLDRDYDALGDTKAVDETRASTPPPAPAAVPGRGFHAYTPAASGGAALDGQDRFAFGGRSSEAAEPSAADHVSLEYAPGAPATTFACVAAPATVLHAEGATGDSVVDALNETEGVRTAALFTYP